MMFRPLICQAKHQSLRFWGLSAYIQATFQSSNR
jgi:hypothetical protein